jgi:hypothetical protein
MRNDAYPKTLNFTELHDRYRDYIIEWAVSPSTSEPGRWMGHFRARKDNTKTLSGSIGDLQNSEHAAQEEAIDVAKFFVDEAIAEQSGKPLNPWDEGDYQVYGQTVPAPGGGYFPAYVIDRVRGIPDAPKIVVKFYEVRSQVCETESLARVMAISHAVHRIRSGDLPST